MVGVPCLWTRMADLLDELADRRRCHRQDGVVTSEEDHAEDRLLVEIVGFASDCGESAAIGHAIGHVGFESKRAQQLIRERCARRGHLRLIVVNDQPNEAA